MPVLEELKCEWVAPCATGAFLWAVQGLRNLKSLVLSDTAAVDVNFVSSTGWVQLLRKINIDWDESVISPDRILHFLCNFTATLTDLTLEVINPFHPTAPPLLLPFLTDCRLSLFALDDMARHLRLVNASVRTLRVGDLGMDDEDWSRLLPLVRQLKTTLRKLVLQLFDAKEGRESFRGSDLCGELEELCRQQGVELEM